MTTLIQAAEQALKAMEESHPEAYRHAITALRQAIALEKMAENERELGIQMKADEPSVKVWRHSRTGHIRVTTPGDITDCDAQWVNVTDQYLSPKPADEPVGEVYRYGKDSHGRMWHGIHWYDPNVDVPTGTKLYTRPQPAIPAPPEAQTEAEKRAYAFGWFKALEHARQTADEPVARVVGYYAGRCVIEPLDRARVMLDNMALYAHPQPKREWVGLTEKEKREARNSVSYSPLAMTMSEWTEAVQDATEAKLKEKNHG